MAEMNVQSSGGKKGGGKPHSKKMSTRVDFTPMVDLGFLLITFFMLTTTLIKPQTMEISMPTKDKIPEDQQTALKASRAITIVLGKEDKVFYYFGTRENDIDPEVITTDFSASGVRKMLLERNEDVVTQIAELEKKRHDEKMLDEDFNKQASEIRAVKTAPVIIIKATDDASYKNLVDILDEMHICNLGKYAIVDVTPYDLELIGKTEPNS